MSRQVSRGSAGEYQADERLLFKDLLFPIWGFPVAQTVKRLPTMWETWVQSLHREDPLEKEIATAPVFLPGKSHGWRSLGGAW